MRIFMLRQMELKIPPVVWLAVATALVWIVHGLWPWFGVDIPAFVSARWPLAGLLLIAGVGVAWLGFLACRQAHTTVSPLHPENASQLVQQGVFGYTRNPMYVGMILALCAWWVLWPSWFGLAVLWVFVWVITRLQIVPEERALSAHFGISYTQYQGRVRRWI